MRKMTVNIKEIPTKVIQGKLYTCYVDICREGLQFCNDVERRCTLCSDNFNACFTYHQQINCTQYCMDQFLQNNENDNDNKTSVIYKWLFVVMVITLILTFIAFLTRYLRAHACTISDAIECLCKTNHTQNVVYKSKSTRRELDLLSYTDSTTRTREAPYDDAVSLTETEHPYDDVERTFVTIVNTTSQPEEEGESGSIHLNGNQRHELDINGTNDVYLDVDLANQVLPRVESSTGEQAEQIHTGLPLKEVPHEPIEQVTEQQFTEPLFTKSKSENDYKTRERSTSSNQSDGKDNDNTEMKLVYEWDCRYGIQPPNIEYKASSKIEEEERQYTPQQNTTGPQQLDASSFNHTNLVSTFCHDRHQITEKGSDPGQRPLGAHVSVREPAGYYSERTQDQDLDRRCENTQPKELYGTSNIPYQRDDNSRDVQLDRDPVRELSSTDSNGFEALPYQNSSSNYNTSGYNSNME